MTREERAKQYYKYIIDNRKLWCNGFTPNRLKFVESAVIADNDIMWDLLDRHQGKEFTPEEMKARDRAQFDHAIGNLSTSILYKMMDTNVIKRHKA